MNNRVNLSAKIIVTDKPMDEVNLHIIEIESEEDETEASFRDMVLFEVLSSISKSLRAGKKKIYLRANCLKTKNELNRCLSLLKVDYVVEV